MITAIAITALVCLAAGIFIGRRYEQKIVAKVLSEFAIADQDARSLVNRCYRGLSDGIQQELDKLLKR